MTTDSHGCVENSPVLEMTVKVTNPRGESVATYGGEDTETVIDDVLAAVGNGMGVDTVGKLMVAAAWQVIEHADRFQMRTEHVQAAYQLLSVVVDNIEAELPTAFVWNSRAIQQGLVAVPDTEYEAFLQDCRGILDRDRRLRDEETSYLLEAYYDGWRQKTLQWRVLPEHVLLYQSAPSADLMKYGRGLPEAARLDQLWYRSANDRVSIRAVGFDSWEELVGHAKVAVAARNGTPYSDAS